MESYRDREKIDEHSYNDPTHTLICTLASRTQAYCKYPAMKFIEWMLGKKHFSAILMEQLLLVFVRASFGPARAGSEHITT